MSSVGECDSDVLSPIAVRRGPGPIQTVPWLQSGRPGPCTIVPGWAGCGPALGLGRETIRAASDRQGLDAIGIPGDSNDEESPFFRRGEGVRFTGQSGQRGGDLGQARSDVSRRSAHLTAAVGVADVTALAGPARDVAPGGESTGVVRAEHPLEVGQQLPEQAQRPRRITALAGWPPITPAPSSKPANADSLRSWAWSWSLRHGSFPAC